MKKQDDIPEIDESQLTPQQLQELHSKKLNPSWIIFFSVMLVLIIACVIVIVALQ